MLRARFLRDQPILGNMGSTYWSNIELVHKPCWYQTCVTILLYTIYIFLLICTRYKYTNPDQYGQFYSHNPYQFIFIQSKTSTLVRANI